MTNKKGMTKWVKAPGYTLYAILVAGLCLYLLFPSQALESYASRRFNQAFPLFSLSLTDLRPSLFGLTVDGAEISLSAFQDQSVFGAEKVRIKLHWHGVTGNQWWIELAGRTGNGTIYGKFLHDDSTAKVHLRLENGKFQLPKTILGVKQLWIRHAQGDMTIGAQTVRILGLNLLSDKGAAALTGSVFVEQQRPDGSRLDLKGSVAGVRKDRVHENKIDFEITGSIAEPKVRLSGANRSSS